MDNKIIHISGPSGSGKTTLGNKLKEKFGSKIVVKDIDDLRREFIKEFYKGKKFSIIDKVEYQKYIDNFCAHSKKPLVFVGLNHMPWWHKNHYYNMHSKYNYFIKITDDTVIKQKCKRLLLSWANSKESMDDLISDNLKYIKNISNALAEDCNLKKTNQMNDQWRKDYKAQGYRFMSREDIFKAVSKILEI